MLAVLTNLRILCAKATIRSFNLSLQKTYKSFGRTKDGSTIVAWHEQVDFPYECTKPLPKKLDISTDTVLKTQMSSELFEVYNKNHPELSRLKLMNITHTTKHRWFSRARDKYAKTTPMERKYL